MTTTDLQLDLINRIKQLTNDMQLKELLQLVQFQSDQSIYITSEEEKEAITEAKTQIANGEFMTNEQHQQNIQKWLQ